MTEIKHHAFLFDAARCIDCRACMVACSVENNIEMDKTRIWVAGEPRLYGWIYYYTSEVWYIFLGCTVFLWILLYTYFHDWRGALRPALRRQLTSAGLAASDIDFLLWEIDHARNSAQLGG